MPDAQPKGIVNRIGTFFLTVVKSCYDMEWYRTVRTRPWTSALRYAATFQAALMLFATAALASQLFGAEAAFVVHLQRTFPDDARLEVKSGHLSTNLREPFEAGSQYLRVVIDTSVEGTQAPERYKGMEGLLIGKDAIFMPQPHYISPPSVLTQQRVYRMEDFSEFSVSKKQLLDWLQAWGGLFILGTLMMFALSYWAVMLLSSGIYAALAAGVSYGLGRLWDVRLSYRAWLATGLHAVTLPLLVNLAMTATNVRIPLAFTFVFFMFVIAVIADERSQPVGQPPAASTEAGPPAPPKPARTRKIAARKSLKDAKTPPGPDAGAAPKT